MKTAICAIIKDEHLFLKEWIDWHLNLGFDAIHLFEDKGSKSHEEIVKDYSNVFLRRYENDEGVQELLEAQGTPYRQVVLYTWFAKEYQSLYDWCAFIDIDEYVFFAEDYNLNKLCEEFEPYPGVLLNWRMMGASGLVKRPDSIVKYYTKEGVIPESEKVWMFKSFCNLKRFISFPSLHRTEDAVNTNHNKNLKEWCYDKAWLNHYFTKSWEDWCHRIFKRGDTNPGHRTLDDFFALNPDMLYLKKELLDNVSNKIPNGTYWLSKKDRLIAGGNVNKILNLSNSNIIQDNQKVLIIGNKPTEQLSEEQIKLINSFDVIIRMNGMNNLKETGNRVDFWWLNIWDWDTIINNVGDKDYSSCKKVLLDNNTLRYTRDYIVREKFRKLKNAELVKTNCSSTKLSFQDSYWLPKKEDGTIPVTDVIAISYFINKYPNTDLYFTGLDIEDRENLFKTHQNWSDTWHRNVGGLEADYLKKQIACGRIKYLDLW